MCAPSDELKITKQKNKDMKLINTTVKTGDIITDKEGISYTVGLFRKINGKNKIELRRKINETSGITIFVSTRELNKIINKTL